METRFARVHAMMMDHNLFSSPGPPSLSLAGASSCLRQSSKLLHLESSTQPS